MPWPIIDANQTVPALNLRVRKARSPVESAVDGPRFNGDSIDWVGLERRVHSARVPSGQGSDSGGSTEMQELLRSRLRSAALLMFAGFAAFFVWHTIRIEFDSALQVAVYAAHFATTLIIAAIGYWLATEYPLTTRQLRVIELVTFGVPLAFFLLMQYAKTAEWVDELGPLPETAPCWMLMVFMYALFIPNSWRRAAAVIGIMAAAPFVGLLLAVMFQPEAVSLIVGDPRVLVEILLVVGLAALSAILGVRTINRPAVKTAEEITVA